MGTFSYMAPEQARGGDIDPRADLFALGVLLYEMLTGRAPFAGPTAADVVGAVLFREPEPLAAAANVPADLERLVMTALRKDRAERYQTGAHLLQDLTAIERMLDPASGGRSAISTLGRPTAPAFTRHRTAARSRPRSPSGGGCTRRRGRRGIVPLPSCRSPTAAAIRSSTTSATGDRTADQQPVALPVSV